MASRAVRAFWRRRSAEQVFESLPDEALFAHDSQPQALALEIGPLKVL